MILDDVTEGTDAVVEPSAPLDPEVLCHRDLHASHVVPVPHGLQHRVREAKDHQVLYRFLPEEMVDPVDLILGEVVMNDVVQLGGRRRVPAERLLEHDSLVQTDRRQTLHDVVEEVRRNGEIREWEVALSDSRCDLGVRSCVRVVPCDMGEIGRKSPKRIVIDRRAGVLERLPSPLRQFVV